jgi:hypothetical protein
VVVVLDEAAAVPALLRPRARRGIKEFEAIVAAIEAAVGWLGARACATRLSHPLALRRARSGGAGQPGAWPRSRGGTDPGADHGSIIRPRSAQDVIVQTIARFICESTFLAD